ncbi:MAG: S24 family peptidase [Pseudomonadota bacterium]
MSTKFIPVSVTYKETDTDEEIGHERPIADERIGRFAERLQSIIGEESVRSFAQRASVNEGSLRNMLRGGLPRLDTLVAIADEAGVNVGWLATGEGRMYRGGHEGDAKDRQLIEQFIRYQDEARTRSKLPHGVIEHEFAKDHGITVDQLHAALRAEKEPAPSRALDEFATAPFYDVEASCGHGAWNSQENIISMLAFRRDWLKQEGLDPAHLAAIRARGDSMEPTIQSGDTLLVDLRMTTPRADGIYIIEQDGGLSAKRIQRAPDGTLYIKSDNPAYQTFVLGPDARVNIVGRLAWFGRRTL